MYKEEKEIIKRLQAKTAQEMHAKLTALGYKASERSVRRWFSELKQTNKGSVQASDKRRMFAKPGLYVITSAQVNTYVHENFLASLLQYCLHNKAEFVVSTFAYKKTEAPWIDHRLTEFIMNSPVQLAKDLVFCGEINILPTASTPLSGFQSYMQAGSGIIPHAKIQMSSLPRLKGEDPRFLYTTGACTLRNYSETKAGAIADFHHVYGALVVNVKDDGTWFVRQLVAEDDGTFCDLDKLYTPDGVEPGKVSAITWGDLHCEELSSSMLDTMTNINKVLQPTYNICHDVLDFGPLSYHNASNRQLRTRLAIKAPQRLDLQSMLGSVVTKLLSLTEHTENVIVVPSNHDVHLERWLNAELRPEDYSNAELWYLLNLKQVQAIRGDKEFNAFRESLNMLIPDGSPIKVLDKEARLVINSVEHGQHGHLGSNGARGTPAGFKSVGTRINIGHTHSAGIMDGVYIAGCMCNLDLGYNQGPSSWSHSFIITYGNGKRSIVTIRNESEWR